MKSQQIEKYRNHLIELSNQLNERADSLESEVTVPTGGQSAGGLSNVPLHMADVGSDVFSQELSSTLLENELRTRNELNDALDRIERGTFGVCENCGKTIPSGRLVAIPYARYCVPCVETMSPEPSANLNTGRPPTWLGAPGHEQRDQESFPGIDVRSWSGDIHGAGTPGGGCAIGGIAGTTIGAGEPGEGLEDAMGSSQFDASDTADDEPEMPEAFSDASGGAVGGTPANKRTVGGKDLKQ